MNYIEKYYEKIETKEVIVSEKVRKVYKHLVSELTNKESVYFFDLNKAQHAIDFIQKYCKHSKGKYGGKPFILELWQLALVSAIFGFVHKKTKLRRFHEIILIVARKNGKSALASAIGLYMLFADGEQGPEIYSAATKRDQSKIIWLEAKKMIKKSAALARRSKCLVSEITSLINDGTFKPLSSDSNSLDGLNVHCSLIDELHAIKDKNLYDVIVDGMTAREQPLSVITSTAGTVREGIFDLKYEECERIINGYELDNYKDMKTLPIIYELDNREEWTNPDCWQKANPGLGTIKSLEQLADKVEKAKYNSLLINNLLCKDFNVRSTSSNAFLTWEEVNNPATFELEKMKPKYVIGGFDLSQRIDLTCATIMFKTDVTGPIYVVQQYFMPSDVVEERIREDKVPYKDWIDAGYITAIPGNKIDTAWISKWFIDMQKKYKMYFYKIGYDEWGAQELEKQISDYIGACVLQKVIQGKKTLSSPMYLLKADLAKKNIIYNKNPVLQWCMLNTNADVDVNGNIQPIKNTSRSRIDGFASLLDAYVVYQNNMTEYNNLISF